MVNLNEIQKVLDKLENNVARINYLKRLLEDIKDRGLKNEIKFLIVGYEKVLELEAKQILSKEKWSNEEIQHERREVRTLERQVTAMPLQREEKKEEIKYGVSHSDLTYEPHRLDYDPLRNKIMNSLRGESMSFSERLPSTPEQKNLIEERVRKYMPNASDEAIHQEVSSISNQFHYETQQQSRTYASVSEEVHEKERKKHNF